jgi:hypothetical protein
VVFHVLFFPFVPSPPKLEPALFILKIAFRFDCFKLYFVACVHVSLALGLVSTFYFPLISIVHASLFCIFFQIQVSSAGSFQILLPSDIGASASERPLYEAYNGCVPRSEARVCISAAGFNF